MQATTENEKTSGPGVEFTETMRGFASMTVLDDYESARAAGQHAGTIFEFTVTVTAPDIDRLIANPAHEAILTGSVNAPLLSPTPMRVEQGRFNLLVRDADRPGTRRRPAHASASTATRTFTTMPGRTCGPIPRRCSSPFTRHRIAPGRSSRRPSRRFT